MFHAHDQETAAKLGIDLMEELPDTRVEKHFEGFRLHFGDNWIDFAQAVALQYYLFTVEFGALRAGMKLPPEHRRIILAMDRFPGPSPKSRDAGKRLQQTRGNAFISYVRATSATRKGIKSENDSVGLDCQFGNLDWWRENDSGKWKKGKDHPHFVLPDWAAAAAIAKEFPDEFASSFRSEKSGNDALEGLLELYDTFKKFTLWSMGSTLPLHIAAKSRLWQVPDDAKQYILERASAR